MSHIATPSANYPCPGWTLSERPHDPTDTTRPRTSGPWETFKNTPVDPEPPRHRSSAFFEAGLEGQDTFVDAKIRRNSRPKLQVRFRSQLDILAPDAVNCEPELQQHIEVMPRYFPTLPRLLFLAFCIALILPSLGNSPLLKAGISPIGAKAGPVGVPPESRPKSLPQKRQDTTVCKRWSGQSALVNGTLYYYSGRSITSGSQTTNEWSEYEISSGKLHF